MKMAAFSTCGCEGDGNPPDVVAVAQRKEGKHADGGMFNGMDSAHEVKLGGLNALHQVGFDFDPEADGFKGLLREVKRVPAPRSSCEKGAASRSR